MGGLFKSNGVDSSSPVISSIQLQTSSFGRPITWIFGRQRVAPNLIQYEDFTAIPHSTSQRTGKGGGGAPTSTDYTYSVAAIMALGTGALDSIGKVWKDKEKTTLAELNFDFYKGDALQEPFPYLTTKHPDRALSYRGIGYVASGAYNLGSSATFGNHTFEIQAPGSIAANYPGADVPDTEVADVITALLTDPEQGVGLDPSTISDLTAFRNYCLANGLWVSPAYTEQRGAFDYIKSLLIIGFADCVYSGGKFKIVPYSDVAASSSLAAYHPTIAPVVDLGIDDFIADADTDAVRIFQKSAEESFNHVRVKFSDRANDYNDNIAESKDDADIEQHGLRSMDVVDLKEIADAAVAQKVADFILHRALYIANTYEFRLPWKHVLLEPMDVVTLTYAPKFLDGTPVLITSIEEDVDGLLTVMAEDYPLGSNRHSSQPVPDIGNTAPNYAILPGDVAAPVVFEPPGKLTGNELQVWVAVSGGPNWGGAVVWASTDDQSYQRIGSIRSKARHGVLSAPLPAGAAIDEANTLSVDLALSHGELAGATEANARDLLTTSYVGGEYIAYATETLTGANAYRLQYLVRGAYGSDIGAHAAGTPFVFLDNAVFRYGYPREWVGKTLYFKLTSFNLFGGSMQDLSEVQTFAHVLSGSRVTAAAYLNAAPKVFGIQLDWGLPPGSEDQVQFSEIWWSQTPDRAAASKLDSFAAPQNTYALTGLQAGAKFYFWVRLVDRMGNLGEFYPPGVGVAGSTATDAKVILDWLAGQIGKTQLAADLLKEIDLIGGLDSIRDSIASAHLTALLAANSAIIKETEKRTDAILAEATTRGAAITSVQTSVQTKTDSLATRIDTVSAATASTAAVVQTEITARTTATTALASQITTVAATAAANTAAITSEQTARAAADGATATRVDAVIATSAANTAAITSEQTARANAVGAIATRVDAVVATSSANTAAITSEQTARANADGALSTRIDTVSAAAGNALGLVTSEINARADADGALGRRIDTVQATANGASAAVQATSTALAGTDGKLAALHTIKTQVSAGGRTYMAGIGIGVEVNGTVVESQILLSAQRVAIIDENSAALTTPFVVQGGQVFINQAFIGDATIGTLKIAGNSVMTGYYDESFGSSVPANGGTTLISRTIDLGDNFNSGLILSATVSCNAPTDVTVGFYFTINGAIVGDCRASLHSGYADIFPVSGFGAPGSRYVTITLVAYNPNSGGGANRPFIIGGATMGIMGGKR